jgi:selenocysteine lyase/cysteine desulfurase
VRGLAARLVGAREAHEVAFVADTSDGLSVVSAGLDWRAGDNVVGADCEFPSNVYPWMRLGPLGVEYRMAPERDGRVEPEELFAFVDDHTRVVALSWVQFASGFRSDLERIGRFCRDHKILFVVDAIQALGVHPLDVERDLVDVFAASAHKWLLGGEGVGLLYVSDRVVDQLEPARVGWTSVRDWIKWSRYDLTYREGAGRFECGTLNTPGIHALGASLELLLDAGAEAIEARCKELTDRLVDGLADRGFEIVSSRRPGEWSAIVAARHPEHAPNELVRRLAERGVTVAHRAGRLRVSPHFYNTTDEIDRLLAAL